MEPAVKLHVLTAVSRPENLGRVAESLAVAAAKVQMVDLCWHWDFDLSRSCIGGQALKNGMLDDITDGWVFCLDDDTLVHPDALGVFEEYVEIRPEELDAVVVSQQRTDGRVLPATPSQAVPGGIDIGQAFLRREWLGTRRIPRSYEGDGVFLMEVLAPPARVAWLPDVVSLHNAISGVDVSA